MAVGINAKDGDGSMYPPSFKDADLFNGTLIHSFSLSPTFDVTDRDVCVIGNGSTAVPLVEAFVPQARSLMQICRTPREIHKKLLFEDACNFLDAFGIDKTNDQEVFNFFDKYFHERIFTCYGEASRELKLGY